MKYYVARCINACQALKNYKKYLHDSSETVQTVFSIDEGYNIATEYI